MIRLKHPLHIIRHYCDSNAKPLLFVRVKHANRCIFGKTYDLNAIGILYVINRKYLTIGNNLKNRSRKVYVAFVYIIDVNNSSSTLPNVCRSVKSCHKINKRFNASYRNSVRKSRGCLFRGHLKTISRSCSQERTINCSINVPAGIGAKFAKLNISAGMN